MHCVRGIILSASHVLFHITCNTYDPMCQASLLIPRLTDQDTVAQEVTSPRGRRAHRWRHHDLLGFAGPQPQVTVEFASPWVMPGMLFLQGHWELFAQFQYLLVEACVYLSTCFLHPLICFRKSGKRPVKHGSPNIPG